MELNNIIKNFKEISENLTDNKRKEMENINKEKNEIFYIPKEIKLSLSKELLGEQQK